MRIFKKKGFTLIELLAVIVLLGVISIIAIPNIAKLLKDNKQNLYEKQLDVIETAAKLWSIEEENKIFLMANQSWPYFITISDLKASSFIDGDINNPLTDEPFPESTVINIDYINNNYVFTVNESSIDENSAIIKLNGDKKYNVEVYDDYVDLGATAIDSNNNDLSSNITTEIYQRGLPVSNIDTTILTNYTIKYTVTYTDIDNNYHTAIETRRVNIVDTTAPTLTCTNYSGNTINVESSSSIELPEVVVTDNYDNDISIVKIGSISSIIPGNKKLIYVATDDSGNSSTLTFNFIVKDTIAPVITEILLLEDSSNSLKYYKVNATDSGSGIKEYSFDGGKTWQKSNIYYPSGDITGSELVFVKDNAGNVVSRQLVTEIVYEDGTVIYYDVEKGKACSNYHPDNSLTGYNGIITTTASDQIKTENQTSCLKFYAFLYNEGDAEVKLLLDHNTTDMTSAPISIEGFEGVLEGLKYDTESWVGTITPENYTITKEGYGNYTIDYSGHKARLITANEVAEITGNTSFDESYSNYFNFNSLTTSPAQDCWIGNTSGCKYGWLYDRTTEDCTYYGCLNNSDIATYGYLTSTPIIGESEFWVVSHFGYLGYDVYDACAALRPVITVLKSKLINDNTGEDTNTTYEITYDCNGGTGSTASSTHTYGVASNLSTNGCSRITTGTGTGTSASPNVYSFVGWSTSSTATEATYTDGQSVADIAESGTVTLYAVWSKLFTYSNKYQVIDDNNGNWRVKFLESGTFTPKSSTSIDIFLVGGGGGGSYSSSGGGGGGGGYTFTKNNYLLDATKTYTITIGSGGAVNGNGGTTSAFTYSIGGGKAASGYSSGAGGSGGGGGTGYGNAGGNGGSNGNNGGSGSIGTGGIGQGSTTREFGESTGTLYAGGGGASRATGGSGGGGNGWNGSTAGNGTDNTGGGGGGGHSASSQAGTGGKGVVVIRNARNVSDIGIDIEYTGDYETIDDGNGNWRVKFKTSGTLTSNSTAAIDIFLVGGGGAGSHSSSGGGGGGGGYTLTAKNYSLEKTTYTIVVGDGGSLSSPNGKSSSAFGFTANGGTGGSGYNSGSGGSGGGGGTGYGNAGGNGGSDGSNGGAGSIGKGGTGQGSTTREFGESTGTLYSGGGGASGGASGGAGGGGNGYGSSPIHATANTGGGGGGGHSNTSQVGLGGSGIVIIRNAR